MAKLDEKAVALLKSAPEIIEQVNKGIMSGAEVSVEIGKEAGSAKLERNAEKVVEATTTLSKSGNDLIEAIKNYIALNESVNAVFE